MYWAPSVYTEIVKSWAKSTERLFLITPFQMLTIQRLGWRRADRYTIACTEKRTAVNAIIELLIKSGAEQRENSNLGRLEKAFGEHGTCKALEWWVGC